MTTGLAHVVAKKMAEHIGQPIVVVPMPGAMGQIGSEAIIKAAPDGYTIGMCADGPITVIPAGKKKAGITVPYTHKDFTAIGRMGYTSLLLVVRGDAPVKTVNDLIDYAIVNRGKVSAASAHPTGTMSIAILNAEIHRRLQKDVAKADRILDVRYWSVGEPRAFGDMTSSGILFMVSTLLNAKPHLDSGLVRGIGFVGDEPNPLMPSMPVLGKDVPGLGGFMGRAWTSLCGPRDIPADVVDTLNRAMIAALKDNEVASKFAFNGLVMRPSSASELAEEYKRQSGEVERFIFDLDIDIYGSKP